MLKISLSLLYVMWILFGTWFFINLITFILRGIDKRKARKRKRRISEKTLLLLSLAGGRLGAILAIDYFKHKTIKSRFVWKLYVIAGIWILGLIIIVSKIQ